MTWTSTRLSPKACSCGPPTKRAARYAFLAEDWHFNRHRADDAEVRLLAPEDLFVITTEDPLPATALPANMIVSLPNAR